MQKQEGCVAARARGRAITNKSRAFETDTRSKGCPYPTAIKWLKPEERAKIAAAAKQAEQVKEQAWWQQDEKRRAPPA